MDQPSPSSQSRERDATSAPPVRHWPWLIWLLWLGLVLTVAGVTWYQHLALLTASRLVVTFIRAGLAGAAGLLLIIWLELHLEAHAG